MNAYDPHKKPSPEDCGTHCTGCGRYLLYEQGCSPVRCHPSGNGIAYECPCGEPLHENAHGYVFADTAGKDTPVRPWPFGPDADKPFEIRFVPGTA